MEQRFCPIHGFFVLNQKEAQHKNVARKGRSLQRKTWHEDRR